MLYKSKFEINNKRISKTVIADIWNLNKNFDSEDFKLIFKQIIEFFR